MTRQPPAFQFYPQDFLSDLHIQSMTDAECGRYIKLLCHCWIEDGLEIGNPVVDRAFKKYPILKKYFIEKNNKFFNSRLNKERKKQKRFHRAMKKAGINTAIKRWGGDSLASSQATDKLIASRPSSSSSSSSSSYRDNKEICKREEPPYPPLPPIPKNTAFEIKDTLEKLRLKIREIEGLAENEKKRQMAGLTQDEAQGKIKSLKSQYMGIVKELEETRKA